MHLHFASAVSPEMAASMVHRMYQLGSLAVRNRLHGQLLDSKKCIDHAMRLADYLLSPEANNEGAQLLMTRSE